MAGRRLGVFIVGAASLVACVSQEEARGLQEPGAEVVQEMETLIPRVAKEIEKLAGEELKSGMGNSTTFRKKLTVGIQAFEQECEVLGSAIETLYHDFRQFEKPVCEVLKSGIKSGMVFPFISNSCKDSEKPTEVKGCERTAYLVWAFAADFAFLLSKEDAVGPHALPRPHPHLHPHPHPNPIEQLIKWIVNFIKKVIHGAGGFLAKAVEEIGKLACEGLQSGIVSKSKVVSGLCNLITARIPSIEPACEQAVGAAWDAVAELCTPNATQALLVI